MDIITEPTVCGAVDGTEMVALMPGVGVAYSPGSKSDEEVGWCDLPAKLVRRVLDRNNNAAMRLIVTNPYRESEDELTYMRHVDGDTGVVTEMVAYLGRIFHLKKGLTFDGSNVVAIPNTRVLKYLAIEASEGVALTINQWRPDDTATWKLFRGDTLNSLLEVPIQSATWSFGRLFVHTAEKMFEFAPVGDGDRGHLYISPQLDAEGEEHDLRLFSPSDYNFEEGDGQMTISKK